MLGSNGPKRDPVVAAGQITVQVDVVVSHRGGPQHATSPCQRLNQWFAWHRTIVVTMNTRPLGPDARQ